MNTYGNAITCLKQLRNLMRLAKQHLPRWTWFKSRHCYLIIGCSGAGKSSLLQKSYADIRTINGEDAHTDGQCWLHNNDYFIEFRAQEKPTDATPAFWQRAFLWLRGLRLRFALDGILVCIDCEALRSLSEQQQQIHILQQNLSYLRYLCGNKKPLQLLICKADLILGFAEYFSDLNQFEREQRWGLTLSKRCSETEFANVFQKFIEQIQKHLVVRLQQESRRQQRELIIDFPLQIESLKNTLFEHINTFRQPVVGCYFTSAKQLGHPIDRLHQPLSQGIALLPVNHAMPSSLVKKAFFIQAHFTDLAHTLHLEHPLHKSKINKRIWLQRVTLFMLPLLILASIVWWDRELKQEIQHLSQAQHALNHYVLQSRSNKQNLTKLLRQLSMLETALNALDDKHPSWLPHIHQPRALIKKAQSTYQHALRHNLLPLLAGLMQHELSELKQNPPYLYQTLTSYAMLDSTQHYNGQRLLSWLSTYADKHLAKQERDALLHHAHALAQLPFQAYEIDRELLNSPRQQLQKLAGNPLLGLIILQEQHNANQQDVLDGAITHLFSANNIQASIPYIYLPKHFNHTLMHGTKQAAAEASHGNWVLGHIKEKPKNISALAQQIQLLYIDDYVGWWEDRVNQLKPEHFASLVQARNKLRQLAGKQAHSLQTIIQAIKQTTAIDNKNVEVPQPFLALTQLVDNDSEQHLLLTSIQQQLFAVAQDIDTVLQSHDPDAAAFNFVKLRFATKQETSISRLLATAKKTPAPLGQWLEQWAQNSWQLLLTRGQHHVNQRWQETIMPFYQNAFYNRYPLFAKAQHEVKLNDFTEFFAAHGRLQQFYNTYIQAFVDSKQTHWRMKVVDGGQLNLNQQSLQMFTQAQIIRRMFFNKNDKLAVNFSLEPLRMATHTDVVTMHLGQQQFSDYRDLPAKHLLHWPSGQHAYLDFNPSQVSLHGRLQGDGEWGLFRLLQQAAIKTYKDPRTYAIQFNKLPDKVAYRLHAQSVINPFIPDIIDAFRCPVVL